MAPTWCLKLPNLTCVLQSDLAYRSVRIFFELSPLPCHKQHVASVGLCSLPLPLLSCWACFHKGPVFSATPGRLLSAPQPTFIRAHSRVPSAFLSHTPVTIQSRLTPRVLVEVADVTMLWWVFRKSWEYFVTRTECPWNSVGGSLVSNTSAAFLTLFQVHGGGLDVPAAALDQCERGAAPDTHVQSLPGDGPHGGPAEAAFHGPWAGTGGPAPSRQACGTGEGLTSASASS